MADDERPAGEHTPASGAGHFLTKKAGPLPTWAWIALATAAVVVLWTMGRSRSGGGFVTGSDTATHADTGGGGGPDLGPTALDIATFNSGIASLRDQIASLNTGATSAPSAPTYTTTTTQALEPPPEPYPTPPTSSYAFDPVYASTIITASDQQAASMGLAPSQPYQVLSEAGQPVIFGLSADAIARGGVPAKDIPLTTHPTQSAPAPN